MLSLFISSHLRILSLSQVKYVEYVVYLACYFSFTLELLTDPCDDLLQKYTAEKSCYQKLE